jgi:hypothetical protein
MEAAGKRSRKKSGGRLHLGDVISLRTRNALVHGDPSVEIEPYHLTVMNSALDALKEELEDR